MDQKIISHNTDSSIPGLQAFLSSLSDCIVAITQLNDCHHVIYANQAFVIETGFNIHQLNNQPLSTLFPTQTDHFIEYLHDDFPSWEGSMQCPTGERNVRVVSYQVPAGDPASKVWISTVKFLTSTDTAAEHIRRVADHLERDEVVSGIFQSNIFGMAFCDHQHRIIAANQVVSDIIGIDQHRIKGKKTQEIGVVPNNPADRQRFWDELERNGFVKNFEIDVEANNQSRNLSISGEPIKIREYTYWLLSIQDISHQTETYRLLKDSNDRFRLAMKASKEAIWEWDFKGKRRFWSEGTDNILTRKRRNNAETNWEESIHPHDRKLVRQTLDAVISNPDQAYWQHEYRIRNKEKVIYVEDRGFILRDETGKATKMIGSIVDITIKKSVQENLLESTIRAQEKERNRIAADLHDGVMQDLAAANITLNKIKSLTENEPWNKMMGDLDQIIQKIATDIHGISHNLMSADVERMSMEELLVRLNYHLNSLTEQITFHLEVDIEDEKRIKSEVKVNLYRALQEVSNNILKHSNATEARITFRENDHSIKVAVRDNGIGLPGHPEMKQGIGLHTMRNRIRDINGTIVLKHPKQGLIVEIEVLHHQPYEDEV